jgi:hypothetical protein
VDIETSGDRPDGEEEPAQNDSGFAGDPGPGHDG